MSDNLVIFGAPETTDDMDAKAVDVLDDAKQHAIFNRESYDGCAEIVRMAKAFQKEVHAVWDPVCTETNKAHKAATKARKDQLAPFVEAERIAKGKLDEWDREQQRKRDEERRQREAEQRRLLEEAQRKAEEAAEQGKADEAEKALEAAVELESMPVVEPEPEAAPSGVSYIDNWKAHVIDESKVPREFLTVDYTKLNKFAKLTEGQQAVAGVEFVNERIVRTV